MPLPSSPAYSGHTYHLYVIRVPDRDYVQAKLGEAGIETGVHYPIAIPFMEAYENLGHSPSDFPVAYEQMSGLLSLPMYAELTREKIAEVCRHLKNAVSRTMAAEE